MVNKKPEEKMAKQLSKKISVLEGGENPPKESLARSSSDK